jgi:16S rRNA (cytidine1402-2'-O)-methyltransferase
LTKIFEKIYRGDFSEICNLFEQNIPKGEFVIVISGVNDEELKKQSIEKWSNFSIDEHISFYTNKGMSKKEAMKSVAKDLGVSKSEIYSKLCCKNNNEC